MTVIVTEKQKNLVPIRYCINCGWRMSKQEIETHYSQNLVQCPKCGSRPLYNTTIIKEQEPEKIEVPKVEELLTRCWKCGNKLVSKPYGLYCKTCCQYRKVNKQK